MFVTTGAAASCLLADGALGGVGGGEGGSVSGQTHLMGDPKPKAACRLIVCSLKQIPLNELHPPTACHLLAAPFLGWWLVKSSSATMVRRRETAVS